MDYSTVRESNLALALTTIRTHAPISRARLARLTGINKVTVSSLMQELEAKGLAVSSGRVARSGRGRPAMPYTLNGHAGVAIGLHIDPHYAHVTLSNFLGESEARWGQPLRMTRGPRRLLRPLRTLVQEALDRARGMRRRVLGLGTSLPGVVDVVSGTLLYSPHLGLEDVPVRSMLEELTGGPVYIENEAKAAAIGEWLLGAGRGVSHFLYLSGGWGVGGAAVIGGQVFRGIEGLATIAGHMVVDPRGARCQCGTRGCWETLVSLSAIARRVGLSSLLRARDASTPIVEETVLNAIVQRAQAGHKETRVALSQVGRDLGLGVGNLIFAFNPSRVILGRAYSLLAPYVLPGISKTLGRGDFARFRRRVTIVPSTLGYEAPLVGAAALVIREVLRNPRRSHMGVRP
ncbi:MAG TPA: ROK family protein [Nitrospiraceae bacterium]|nr:ROK family protein [Nitrospiraceae bacterium]